MQCLVENQSGFIVNSGKGIGTVITFFNVNGNGFEVRWVWISEGVFLLLSVGCHCVCDELRTYSYSA